MLIYKAEVKPKSQSVGSLNVGDVFEYSGRLYAITDRDRKVETVSVMCMTTNFSSYVWSTSTCVIHKPNAILCPDGLPK